MLKMVWMMWTELNGSGDGPKVTSYDNSDESSGSTTENFSVDWVTTDHLNKEVSKLES